MADNFQWKPISSATGIYYELFGTTNFHESDWCLVTYTDITTFDNNLELVKITFDKTISMCNNGIFKNLTLCQPSINILNEIIQLLVQKSQTLKDLTGQTKSRTKRAWFDIVGTAFKTAFGTMDNDDAEHYETIINSIHNDDIKMVHLLKDQTQVVKLQ